MVQVTSLIETAISIESKRANYPPKNKDKKEKKNHTRVNPSTEYQSTTRSIRSTLALPSLLPLFEHRDCPFLGLRQLNALYHMTELGQV